MATGRVTQACYDQHRHEEFLRFLKLVAKNYPRRKLHIVCDNYGTHKHPVVRAWLERNPRITLHFTPTSGSWLNMVSVFFGIITREAIRRGTFRSVKDLIGAITRFIDGGTTGASRSCGPRPPTRSSATAEVRRPHSHDTSFSQERKVG